MLKIVLLASAIGFAFACGGCASGEDGWNQACANANTTLQAGYQLATGEMKKSEADGTVKQLMGCFTDFDAALHAAEKEKNDACDRSKAASDFNSYAAKVQNLITNITGITSTWKTCSLKILANGGK
jgi:hypothetical protein